MNCKVCGAELEENASVCAACGEAVEMAPVEEVAPAQETAPVEKKKKEKKPMGKGAKAIIAISLALVLLLGIATAVVGALGINFSGWENNLYFKDRYTAPDFMAAMAKDTVVATMGDKELTNGMLQLYFGRQLWDLVEEYGDYLTSMGLDLDKPLYQQEFPGADGATWEQYLLSMALGAWSQQQALVCLAEEEGFQYPDGLEIFLDSLKEKLDAQAVANGLKDGNALVRKEMGATADVELYKAYSAIYNKSMEYYNALYENMEPTPEEVEAYFDAHAEEIYSQYYIEKTTNPVIDVRHILLMPKADTEESKAVCRQKAEELLEQWKNGEATEESFAQLANEYSEDPGSNTNGGLYEYVYQGDMVDTFDAWCFDESRQYGDYGLVETEYGYHLMYFVYGADEWYRMAYETLCSEMCQQIVAAGYEEFPSKVYFYNIMLSQIDFE